MSDSGALQTTELRERVEYLDGLRGAGALSVVISHLAAAFYPSLYFADIPGFNPTAETPLFAFISGTFAVFIFFILSGYVLSIGVASKRKSILLLVPTRLIRLGVPASIAAIFAFGLWYFGMIDVRRIQSVTGHKWVGLFYQDVSATAAVAEILGIYFVTGSSKLNQVLWTMRVELLGSYLVYGIYAVRSKRITRLWILLAAVTAFIAVGGAALYFICFPIGIAFFDWRDKIKRISVRWGWAAFSAGMVLGGYPYGHEGTMYNLLGSSFDAANVPFSGPLLTRTLGAALVVLAVLRLPTLQIALESRPAQFLGKVSFPLYLLHFPLLFSLYAVAYGAIPAIVGIPLFLVVLFALCWIMDTYVDQPLLKALRHVQFLSKGNVRDWLSRLTGGRAQRSS